MMRKAALAAPENLTLMNSINPDNIFCDEDFSATSTVIVAVSGGGDSVALLFLVRDYLTRMQNSPCLVAITVDHGLRPQSANEAIEVARLCAQYDIAHQTICWKGEKSSNGVQERARLARYQLLGERAGALGADVILTGHTLEDQVETLIMRQAREKIPPLPQQWRLQRGQVGMVRNSVIWQQFRLIRPLLTTRRAHLRGYLKQCGLTWIEDPSNQDPRFERVRVRQSLKQFPKTVSRFSDQNCNEHTELEYFANCPSEIKNVLDEATFTRILCQAKQALEQRRWYNLHAVMWLRRCPPQRLGELCQFNLADEFLCQPILPQILADFACIIGGGQYLRPAPAQLRTFLTQATPPQFNWAGTIFAKQGANVRLWRERRFRVQLNIAAQANAIWDGRYQIYNKGTEPILIRTGEISELRPLASKLGVPVATLRATPVIIGKARHKGQKLIKIPIADPFFDLDFPVHVTRILYPFSFLQSQEEAALIAYFHKFFALREC